MHKPRVVSDLVVGELEFLLKLAYSGSVLKFIRLITKATTTQLLCLVEVGLNVSHGTVQLSDKELTRITPYLKTLKNLSVAEDPQGARKVLLTLGGIGLMPVLLRPVLTMIERQVQ